MSTFREDSPVNSVANVDGVQVWLYVYMESVCVCVCECVQVNGSSRSADTTDRQDGGDEKDGNTGGGRRAAFARSDSAAVGPRHLSALDRWGAATRTRTTTRTARPPTLPHCHDDDDDDGGLPLFTASPTTVNQLQTPPPATSATSTEWTDETGPPPPPPLPRPVISVLWPPPPDTQRSLLQCGGRVYRQKLDTQHIF